MATIKPIYCKIEKSALKFQLTVFLSNDSSKALSVSEATAPAFFSNQFVFDCNVRIGRIGAYLPCPAEFCFLIHW